MHPRRAHNSDELLPVIALSAVTDTHVYDGGAVKKFYEFMMFKTYVAPLPGRTSPVCLCDGSSPKKTL